jgi:hypothetical protein
MRPGETATLEKLMHLPKLLLVADAESIAYE